MIKHNSVYELPHSAMLGHKIPCVVVYVVISSHLKLFHLFKTYFWYTVDYIVIM